MNEYGPIDGDKVTIYPIHGDSIEIEGLAIDINNARTVVLYGAKLWTPRRLIQPPVDSGLFRQVNAGGLAVGTRFPADGFEWGAIAWDSKRDELIELAPTSVYPEARAVNNRGEVADIVASSMYSVNEAVIWVVRR